MSIITKIKDIIDADVGTYGSLTDKEVADALNAKTQPGARKLIGTDLLEYLGASVGGSILAKLEAAAVGDTAIKWALEDLKRGGIDVNNPATQSIIDALVTVTVITQAEGDALKALANNQASIAENAGIGFVKVGYVSQARAK